VATGAGEVPALSLVPRRCALQIQPCQPFNPEAGRKLLADAGFPDGKGFPKLEILYNNDNNIRPSRSCCASSGRTTWELRPRSGAKNGVVPGFAAAAQVSRCRRAWVGDYVDPNTYLDMFVSGGENNCTGFANPPTTS